MFDVVLTMRELSDGFAICPDKSVKLIFFFMNWRGSGAITTVGGREIT